MPELPEVETSRRGIEPHVKNRRIEQVVIREHRLRWPIPENLPALASGRKVNAVSRRGKYILLELDRGSILIHLGMSGSLRICKPGTPPEKHDHIDIRVSTPAGRQVKILRLRDPRRFGCVLWIEGETEQHRLLKALGPEPLSEDFSADYLWRQSRGRSSAVKSFIMNSHIVVGVGNIYACEALFRARISPKRRAGNISLQRYHRLVDEIRATLSEAIDQGGTTLRDFTAESGQPGYFKQKLLVYGRTGESCVICAQPVKQITQQGRSTFYCPHCQR